MSIATEASQHVHVLSTWELYPRVRYFLKRFKDLEQRFMKTIRAFPSRFHDKSVLDQVSTLNTRLDELPRIIITGDDILKEFEITREDVDSKFKEALEVRVFCKSDWQLENWKQYLVSQTEKNESVDIVVVGTISTKENEEYVRSLESLKPWLSDRKIRIPVLFFPKEKELSNEIEKVLEVQIIRGFEYMFFYMRQFFIRKCIAYDPESTDVFDLDIIVAVVQNTVQDGDLTGSYRKQTDVKVKQMPFEVTDAFKEEVRRVLCRRLLCAIVRPLAAKYNIPDFLCYQLLTQLHLENRLREAVLGNTLYELSTLSYNNLGKVGSIANTLRNDLKEADVIKQVANTFQTTQRVTTVMKKMTFEIRGYVRQSLAYSSILDIESPRKNISDELRSDILRHESVYGMGTMYGELEIHLKSEVKTAKDESDVKNEISEQMQKHRYPYPYIVRVIDQEPKLFVRQGDKTWSPFPDKRGGIRIGTAGCFVKDQQGVPHLLTCGHVVDPKFKNRHIVHTIVAGEEHRRFGVSTPQKTICSSSSNFTLLDIAAVTAADDDNIRQAVDYNMRNDDGETKPVSFLYDLSESLVGTTVYKYGGVTDLSHGIVMSIDYCRAEDVQADGDAEPYLMLIEDLPENNDNDQVFNDNDQVLEDNFEREEQAVQPIERSFAAEGDSGAFIYFNDYSVDPAGTIIAASMLNGGHFEIKGDPSPKCTSFLLARGLEELGKRGHYFTM